MSRPEPPEPIVILGTPRSGTSMVAGLFAEHGVWTGPCRPPDRFNAMGFFESLPLKEVLIKNCFRIVHSGQLATPFSHFQEEVDRILAENGYQGGPWLMKHSALYYPVWYQFNPTFICCRRSKEATLRSGNESRFFRDDGHSWEAHQEAMDYVRDHYGGVDVDTERLAKGDLEPIIPAFKAAGIRLNESVARAFIDPELWHY